MTFPLHIGVVEDNDDLRESLVEVLGAIGHKVSGFSCAEDLDEAQSGTAIDLVLLDLNLPGEDGLSLAKRLKLVQPGLRVIMMTTRTALEERVEGYDSGADLYLPKPASMDELLAAVRAMERQIHADTRRAAKAAGTLLKLDTRALRLQGIAGEISINAVEATLLAALARAAGQRLEHWQLIESMGQEVNTATRANLVVRIARLRGKLDRIGCDKRALKSLRTEGYQLCVTLEIH